MEIDIVVPVWNRPMETRSCLVSLIDHSPGARFILVDNGCDRDPQRLLQEFAESLDERALLICTGSNLGLIKAINIGLKRAEASCAVIVQNTCTVTEGWLESLMELTEQEKTAGLVVPPLVADVNSAQKPGRKDESRPCEISSGSLAAMLVRKRLYDSIGGFDEELDSGYWCIRDYTRRAYKAGYLTFAAEGGGVYCREDAPLGSFSRRQENERRSAAVFHERWGEERSYCIWFPKGTDTAIIEQRREALLKGSRQGHTFFLVVPNQLYRELLQKGYDRLHENIVLEPLPRFFPDGATTKILESLRRTRKNLTAICGTDGLHFPGEPQAAPFSSVEQTIDIAERKVYGHSSADFLQHAPLPDTSSI